tara:strand:+ start:707 stop:1069 length:363 start_codon:yes stop_codon:yes gene_type:complete
MQLDNTEVIKILKTLLSKPDHKIDMMSTDSDWKITISTSEFTMILSYWMPECPIEVLRLGGVCTWRTVVFNSRDKRVLCISDTAKQVSAEAGRILDKYHQAKMNNIKNEDWKELEEYAGL